MKVNEKNLINFAMTNSHIDHEGWLCKRGEVNKSFQKRWFLLKGNLLFYFEKKDDKEPLGVIILEGCAIELAEDEETFAFKLVFHGAGDRTYILCANSQDNMESWIKSIASASYDYMKLMVSELQRQMNEITELEKQVRTTIPLRLHCAGLPVNRSDSCLCSHAGSGKNPRFNPFDKWKMEVEIEEVHQKPVANINDSSVPFVAFADDSLPANTQTKMKCIRQKYLFLEIHEYYGQIFRRIFDEQRKKQSNIDNTALIQLD